MNKTARTILFLLLIIAIGLVPYFLIRNHISLTNETFSSLGSYISGIVGILNLCVFVYLTHLVSKYEETKSLNEIKTQKIITQTNFRQAELEKLVLELDKPFDTSQPSDAELSMYRFSQAHIVMNNFLNRKQHLFPILKDKKYFEMGNDIARSFVELIELLELDDKENYDLKFEEIFLKLLDQKSKFIHILQVFIIEELGK